MQIAKNMILYNFGVILSWNQIQFYLAKPLLGAKLCTVSLKIFREEIFDLIPQALKAILSYFCSSISCLKSFICIC